MAYTTQDKIRSKLEEESYTAGTNALTKHNVALLELLSLIYNFRLKKYRLDIILYITMVLV